MGITAIASPLPSSGGNTASGPAGLSADQAPVDFAQLLAQQQLTTGAPGTTNTMAALLAGNGMSLAKNSKLDAKSGNDDPGNGGMVIDPALVAQLPAVPAATPALENRAIDAVDRKNQAELADNIRGEGRAKRDDNGKSNTLLGTAPSMIDTTGSATRGTLPDALTQTDKAANLAGDNAISNSANALGQQAANHVKQANGTDNSAISTPINDQRWSQNFGEKIVWMARNDQQQAHLNINPAHLGPVQITLSLSGDQASASFASPHAEVRQAIEDSLPRLREMLSGAGINLGNADVGSQLARQQSEQGPRFSDGARFRGETAILAQDGQSGTASASIPINRGRGMVDLFA